MLQGPGIIPDLLGIESCISLDKFQPQCDSFFESVLNATDGNVMWADLL